MKRLFGVLSLFSLVGLYGCFEITLETTINKDGSGLYASSTDMGAVMGMLKSMGGDEAKEFDSLKKDTLVSMAYLKDSIAGLTDIQKKLLEKASLRIVFNTEEEKMLMSFEFPFDQPSDMALINDILKKTRAKAISKELLSMVPGDSSAGDQSMMGETDNETPDLEDYFEYSYEKGKISKKINKEKFATVANDQNLKSIQEMTQLGAPMTLKTIINLPRAATKAEGKGLKLSEDKKKITIEGTIEDFFENPDFFEYVIEY
jgi:hypothetical protein